MVASTSRSIALAAADPVTANQSVYAVVEGEAPTVAPTINNIASGTVITSNEPITLTGTCPADTLIKVYKNEVLAGATFCQNGRYSIQIDLFLGANTIIVRAYNAVNTPGPESAPVVVQKTIAGVNIVDASEQFFITSEAYFKGVNPGENATWPITLTGGQAPYAVSVAWGDGKTDLMSRGVAGQFEITHKYQQPGEGFRGSYDVTIMASDAVGRTAYLRLVTIVGGQPAGVVNSIKRGYDLSGAIRIGSQLLGVALVVVLAFWLGERRELMIMKRTKRA